MTSYEKELRFEKAVRESYKRSLTPTNGWSPTTREAYQHSINVLAGCLRTMEKLEGDKLQAYANRFGISKPELKEAIERLTRMQEEVPKSYAETKASRCDVMRVAYAEQCKEWDKKSRKAAKTRILPVKKAEAAPSSGNAEGQQNFQSRVTPSTGKDWER